MAFFSVPYRYTITAALIVFSQHVLVLQIVYLFCTAAWKMSSEQSKL